MSSIAKVGLGHRRLSIIDLSAGGKQPMSFDKYWICFNGEVYNYKEIKSELIKLGHSFKSTSDTEVVLHAFIEWGRSCLEKLIGMFAFVIKLILANESSCFVLEIGQELNPSYYYFKDGLFLFGSELKAFHEHRKV